MTGFGSFGIMWLKKHICGRFCVIMRIENKNKSAASRKRRIYERIFRAYSLLAV